MLFIENMKNEKEYNVKFSYPQKRVNIALPFKYLIVQ